MGDRTKKIKLNKYALVNLVKNYV